MTLGLYGAVLRAILLSVLSVAFDRLEFPITTAPPDLAAISHTEAYHREILTQKRGMAICEAIIGTPCW